MQKRHAILSLSSITPHPKNYRTHDEQQLAAIRESLRRFGQTRSIVVREEEDSTYLLLAGHGVYQAARTLGWQSLSADIFPSSLPDREAEAILVADNRLALAAHDNERALLSLLRAQREEDYSLFTLGSSEEEFQHLLSSISQETQRLRESMRINQEIIEEEESEEQEENASFLPKREHVEERMNESPIGTTREEFLQIYNTTQVRQVVLVMSADEYGWLLPHFSEMRKERHLETNTEVVFALVREELQRQGVVDDFPIEVEEAPV